MLDRRDLSGTTIAGRYRVQRRLGAGGMGAVWLVQHVESLQQYALKTLHPQVAHDRLAVERFLREARAAAALRSKHVVKVVDAQMNHVDEKTHEPMPFLVMELLEGANLEELIAAHTRLPPEEAIWVLRGVARALDVAHQKGIVHRDLKPENIFVSLDDEGEPVPKVCDFGIAKLAGDAATGLMSTGALGTQTGITVGTPMYMSPEQARSSTDVGVESDQWALGLIAFKLLTGREYFSTARSTTELLLKIVNDPLEPPTSRLSTLSPGFDAWFFRSCARDPAERWPSAGEQIAALTEVLGVTEPRPPVIPRRSERAMAMAETISAESVSPEARQTPPMATTAAPASRTMNEPAVTVPAPVRRSRAPLAIAVVAVVALSAVVGTVFLLRSKPVEAEQAVEQPKEPKPKSVATTKPVEPTPSIEKTSEPTATKPTTSAPTAPATPGVKSGKVPAPMTASATATATATSAAKPSTAKLPKGASCTRSSECASGFCVAEECQ